MSRFAYFPGCSLHATACEYDESTRALAGCLDFGLEEIEDWCCCGATPADAIDAESARLLGLWNPAHAAKGGRSLLLTECPVYFSRLRAFRDEAPAKPALGEEARARLRLPIDPDLEVLHIAQALAAEPMRERGFDFRLPVLYLTQLIGLALGLPAERLGLQRHFVPVPVEALVPAGGASRV